MAKKKRKKISRFPNRFQQLFMDPGIILFTMIAIYMLICLVIYWSKPHISVYEVKHGKISKDYTYTGLVLRAEQIVNADRSGYLTYYAREGEKVGAKTTVCALDETGQLSQMIAEATADEALLSLDDILEFKERIQSYQASYDNLDFDEVYTFKQNLESSILETVHLKLLEEATQSMDTSNMINIYKPAADGVLSYHIDGMENLTMEEIDQDKISGADYEATDLKNQTLVDLNDPMYKLVTDENWSVVVALDEELAQQLVDEQYVEITFLKDNKTSWGEVSSWESGGTTFVQFSFTNSMVRYVTERYLELRFNLNDVEGLKLPVSAVREEEFYTIPEEFLTKAGDSDEDGVIMDVYGEDGSVSQTFQKLDIVRQQDNLIYVSKSDFNAGDTIYKTGSEETYSIGKTAKLQGVYKIVGYMKFCPITIISGNSEYYIVDGTQSGGLSQYDRIVLDADMVEDNESLY